MTVLNERERSNLGYGHLHRGKKSGCADLTVRRAAVGELDEHGAPEPKIVMDLTEPCSVYTPLAVPETTLQLRGPDSKDLSDASRMLLKLMAEFCFETRPRRSVGNTYCCHDMTFQPVTRRHLYKGPTLCLSVWFLEKFAAKTKRKELTEWNWNAH
jgi:hypothetical protein